MVDQGAMLSGPANSPSGAAGGLLGGVYPQALPSAQTVFSLGRLARYATYRNFYLGDQWDDLPAPGERRLTFNYARVFVNKAASYLLGKPVSWQALPSGSTGKRNTTRAAAVEDYLDQVGDFNNLAVRDLDTAILAACLGDGAWTVRWDAGAQLPRVTSVDPAALDARWRADDLQTLLWVRQTYWTSLAELTPAQAAHVAQPPSDPYQPLHCFEEWTAREWSLTINGAVVDGGPNPYQTIPYILFPNLRVPAEFWGESDLADLTRLQRELNTRLSIFSRILEVAGNPVAVITGADADSTDTLKLGPNQLWTLPEGAKAEVLDLLKAGGAQAHMQYIDAVYRAMHDISEMPRTSFGDSSHGTQARSGVALEIELQPLLHKLARKRAILSAALERRAQLILTVGRLHGAVLAPVRLRASWPPVLPQDRAAMVQQEATLVAAGIHPPTVAMAMLDDADPPEQWQQVLSEAQQRVAAGLAGISPAPPALPDSTLSNAGGF